MSPLSTSDSKVFTWARLRREVLRLFLLLLCLELFCRWEPVRSYLAQKLDSYENLLWYDSTLPAYQAQLEAHPGYNLWLVGSSYMMTGLDPQIVQGGLHDQGRADIKVQNYGLTRMQDLEVMGEVFDHWMFNMDHPRYVVIGISRHNFVAGISDSSVIASSPYESMYILPSTLDDYVRGFLFQNSLFYHYAVLARNAFLIPREETLLDPIPNGGYVRRKSTYDCSRSLGDTEPPGSDVEGGLARLDRFIGVMRAHDIPVMVVNIPMSTCAIIYEGFRNFDDYAANYLNPVTQHMAAENVPFMALDTRFQAEIAESNQRDYFADAAHPNTKGAALFSQWTADAAATWLKTVTPP